MRSPVAVSLVTPGTGKAARKLRWWPLSAAESRTERESVVYAVEADERLPEGTLPIRQNESVLATDGAVGVVHGAVLTAEGDKLTHLVLEVKRLWRRKRTAVPVRAVAEIGRESVVLSWSQSAVEDLPAFTPEGSAPVV